MVKGEDRASGKGLEGWAGFLPGEVRCMHECVCVCMRTCDQCISRENGGLRKFNLTV